jgi:tRNA(fMet)-specific endonuclease VapC
VHAVFKQQQGRMAISAITLAELVHGAEKSQFQSRNLAVVEDFCSCLTVLPYPPDRRL